MIHITSFFFAQNFWSRLYQTIMRKVIS